MQRKNRPVERSWQTRVSTRRSGRIRDPSKALLAPQDLHHREYTRGSKRTGQSGPQRLGVAGVKGFGGGFAGRCATAFGEPEMKAFVQTTVDSADRLGAALKGLDCDVLVALTHYAPVPDTLAGEPLEIYPFLGSYLLGQAIDSAPT